MRRRGRPTTKGEIRFWAKVHPEPMSGCWLWSGWQDSDGYGRFAWVRGQRYFAHRLAYSLTRGEIPEYFLVRHKCHNRACVNPDHLALGTPADNTADMLKAGRNKATRKLTEQQVFVIRTRAARGERQYQLAKEFGVSAMAISNIVRRRTWQHV